MELIRSNRTEALADALTAQVRESPLDPFEKDVVVVQSRGMERWLTLALTERLGVWANPWFPFPRALIEWALGELDAGQTENSKAYDRSRLKWTIAELLLDAPPRDLADYVSSSSDDDRVLRLSTSVASVFDEYVMYRPDLLEALGERRRGSLAGGRSGVAWSTDWGPMISRLESTRALPSSAQGRRMTRSSSGGFICFPSKHSRLSSCTSSAS
jgi:exodeoxyribonuclease V gamma subunit